MRDRVTCEIVEHLGTFAEYTDFRGEKKTKEINLVSWNGKMPKVDIREWDEEHSRPTKGVTLTDEEAESVAMILHNYISERRAK